MDKLVMKLSFLEHMEKTRSLSMYQVSCCKTSCLALLQHPVLWTSLELLASVLALWLFPSSFLEQEVAIFKWDSGVLNYKLRPVILIVHIISMGAVWRLLRLFYSITTAQQAILIVWYIKSTVRGTKTPQTWSKCPTLGSKSENFRLCPHVGCLLKLRFFWGHFEKHLSPNVNAKSDLLSVKNMPKQQAAI